MPTAASTKPAPKRVPAKPRATAKPAPKPAAKAVAKATAKAAPRQAAAPAGAWAAIPVVEATPRPARPPRPKPAVVVLPPAVVELPPAAAETPVAAAPFPPVVADVPVAVEARAVPGAPVVLPAPAGPAEVTVFRGDSLIAALAAATEALGADVRVRSARRVRQGLSGLLGRERFEVTVENGARRDGLDDAYAGLLGAADAREVAAQPARVPRAEPVHEPVREPARADVPRPRPPAPVPGRAPRRPAAGTTWSRAALRAVGVPEEVLAQLPGHDPADDLAWTVALGTAIGAVVPPPAKPTPEHPVVVDGWAGPGALAIIRAALAGARPGTLHTDAGAAPATAAELAMAVRSCLGR